jgi:hypothetical protein
VFEGGLSLTGNGYSRYDAWIYSRVSEFCAGGRMVDILT